MIIKLENIAMIQSDEWFALRLKSLAGMIRFSLEIKERKEGKKGGKKLQKIDDLRYKGFFPMSTEDDYKFID